MAVMFTSHPLGVLIGGGFCGIGGGIYLAVLAIGPVSSTSWSGVDSIGTLHDRSPNSAVQLGNSRGPLLGGRSDHNGCSRRGRKAGAP